MINISCAAGVGVGCIYVQVHRSTNHGALAGEEEVRATACDIIQAVGV